MKFSLFAHMERLTPEQSQAELYDEFIRLAEIADKGGMHALWTGEHHGMDFTIAPNPFINLADLARRTANLRLGTGTIVAPFWHPIKLAGEAAMCDIITGGRLDIGIARGAYSYEYQRIGGGIEAWEAGQRLRAMIPAIKGLWEGDHAVENEFWSFPATTSAPKPVQQPHPPIWVAARDPSSHDFAVANGCNVQVTPLSMDDAEVDSLMARFNTACTNHPEIKRPKPSRNPICCASVSSPSTGLPSAVAFSSRYISTPLPGSKPILLSNMTSIIIAAYQGSVLSSMSSGISTAAAASKA